MTGVQTCALPIWNELLTQTATRVGREEVVQRVVDVAVEDRVIDNDWVARCVLAKMQLDFSNFTDDEFISECKRAADEFVNECANADQGS